MVIKQAQQWLISNPLKSSYSVSEQMDHPYVHYHTPEKLNIQQTAAFNCQHLQCIPDKSAVQNGL